MLLIFIQTDMAQPVTWKHKNSVRFPSPSTTLRLMGMVILQPPRRVITVPPSPQALSHKRRREVGESRGSNFHINRPSIVRFKCRFALMCGKNPFMFSPHSKNLPKKNKIFKLSQNIKNILPGAVIFTQQISRFVNKCRHFYIYAPKVRQKTG